MSAPKFRFSPDHVLRYTLHGASESDARTIASALCAEDGWRAFGFSFEHVLSMRQSPIQSRSSSRSRKRTSPHRTSPRRSLKQRASNPTASVAINVDVDFEIHMTSAARMSVLFPETHLRGLSVTDSGGKRPVVYLNAGNWNAPPAAFTGSRAMYRRYLVNHEVGHVLGLGHEECTTPNAPAPIMMQQSRGTGACFPDPAVVKKPKNITR